MKTKFSISTLFILFVVFANAQSNIKLGNDEKPEGTITKQDALDFINKIFKDYPSKSDHDPGPSEVKWDYSEKATLDGCLLKMVIKWYSRQTYVSTYDLVTDSTSINLSSVYFDGGYIVSTTPTAIWNSYEIIEYKKNGKLEKEQPIGREDYYKRFNVYMFINSSDPEFKNTYGNYGERYIKALDFLVHACGGGDKPAAPKEKF